MKAWKFWLLGIGCVVVLGASALIAAVWNNISSEWTVEASTAQFALNHSPINHIERHQRFTADGVEEVYYGWDAFHKPYYVFVYGQPLQTKAVPSAGLLTEDSIVKRSEAQHITVEHVEIGYMMGKLAANGEGKSSIVYEVYGRNQQGSDVYCYFDANSGSLLWKYVLST